jgi:hypothetical protein
MSLRPGENWIRSKPVHPRCGLYLPCRGWVHRLAKGSHLKVEVGPTASGHNGQPFGGNPSV